MLSTSRRPTLATLAEKLAAGTVTSRQLVEECLARIADPAGEGARAFVAVDVAGARQAAEAQDLLRKAGAAASPLAGIPIAIKDLADIKAQVTTAGSKALAGRAPATADAPVVARLRAAGLVAIGRANMVEFAYGGIGTNPHYGMPAAPWDRANKHVPGGSSSGSAVAVADGMAYGALGTDTGGSCRIPAAYCGVTGFKPTARRVPTDGVVPLSTSLDSIGPIAGSVDCCAWLDAVMAGETPRGADAVPLAGLRLLVPSNKVLDGLDTHVSADFENALDRLTKAGARIEKRPLEALELIAAMLSKGGLSAAESYAWHHELLAKKRDMYDPRVLNRVLRGIEQTAADYLGLIAVRRDAIAKYQAALAHMDAIVWPTTPIVPPRLADVAMDEDYARLNLLSLRNPAPINIFDGCSIALPMSPADAPPTSLMISGAAMADRRILAIAKAVEGVLG